MISETQTPCIGEVNNNRSKKSKGVAKGDRLEVRKLKEGQWGWFAICFVDGNDKPVFLNPKALDFVSDISDERVAEIDAERVAWVAEKNAPIEIGEGELHSTGKSVVVGVEINCEATAQTVMRRAFFPLSQVSADGDVYSAPPWLVKIKAHDAIYYWVSSGGRKGVDHIGGGMVLSATLGDIEYFVSWADLQDAKNRAQR